MTDRSVLPDAATDVTTTEQTRLSRGGSVPFIPRDGGRLGAGARGVVRRVPPRWRLPLVVYGLCQVVFLGWWVAFYPGLMSYDSAAYTWQVTTGNWMTNHSVAYDALVWLSLQVSGGVSLLTFLQTMLFAAALAYAASGVHRLGVPAGWAALAAVVLPISPTVGTFACYLWKDVPFVICEVALVGVAARLILLRRTGGAGWSRGAEGRRLVLGTFLGLLGLALFRQNGFLMVALAAAVMAAALRGASWRMLGAGVAALAVWLALMAYVFPALGVQSASSDLVLGPAYADISVVYKQRPASFTAGDLALMRRVAPLEHWRGAGNCYTSDVFTGSRNFRRVEADRVHGQLFELWVRVLKRSPDALIQARICRGAIAWAVFPTPTDLGPTLFPPTAVPGDLFGWAKRLPDPQARAALRPDPVSPQLRDAARFVLLASHTRSFEWLLWRGATWALIAYVAVVLFARRRDEWSAVALVAVCLANQLVVLVNNPNQLVRYMTGCICIGVLLLPLLFQRREATAPPARRSLA